MSEQNPSERDALWAGTEPAEVRMLDQRRRNRRLLLVLAFIGIGMFGFAFANVPLFGKICRQLGFAQDPGLGKGGEDPAASVNDSMPGREIEVRFVGMPYAQLPVEFRPVKTLQKVRLGESAVNDYVFINLSKRDVYLRPVHSITPTEAALPDRYKLLQCFCYNEMVLRPGEELRLPVVYKFFPNLDPDVRTVTMNYTLFPITKEQYEEAQKRPKEATP